jgi:CelD/BcsL family acetyltransferase involved in cellulose biosynthesis
LHASRWQLRGESGVLAEPIVRGFHRATLPRLMAAGLADCFLFALDDEVIGAYYGLADPARAYAYLGGFDSRFEEISPGSILIGDAISRAILRGATEFHFLRGPESYKYSWGATDRWNCRRLWTRASGHA